MFLKDTIGTNDKLNTTAGSYALLGSKVVHDAGVVAQLRKAGAIVLGKTSMSEWYKFRSLSGVPNGWCARSGQGVVRTLYSLCHMCFNVLYALYITRVVRQFKASRGTTNYVAKKITVSIMFSLLIEWSIIR